MSTNPDPFDDIVFDESFIAGAPKEATADERIAKAARIARGNDRLAAAGEIAIGIAAAAVIIVVALLVR